MRIEEVKQGMLVRLIDNKGRLVDRDLADLLKNGVYEVVQVDKRFVNIRDALGRIRNLYPDRFEAVEDIPAAPEARPMPPQVPPVPIAEIIPQAPIAPPQRLAIDGVIEVGDIVRIRKVPEEERHKAPNFVKAMEKYIGMEAKVLEVDGMDQIRVEAVLDENRKGYAYRKEWLDLISKAWVPGEGDVVKMKQNPPREVGPWIQAFDKLVGQRFTVGEVDQGRKLFFLKGQEGYVFSVDWFELVEEKQRPDIIKYAVNDWVKVVKAIKGRKPAWIAEMDATIGQLYQVSRTNGVGDSIQLTSGWWYSKEALEPAKDKEVAKKKKATAKKVVGLRDLIANSRKEDMDKCCGTSSYVVFFFDKNGEIKQSKNLSDVCHARLSAGNYYPGLDVRQAMAVIDYIHTYKKQIPEKHHSAYRNFVNYLVNLSPWSIAYHGKTVKNIIDNGVLMNVEVPSGVVAGAAIALRYMKEFKDNLRLWELLWKEGISGDAAYLTCYALSPVNDDMKLFTQQAMGGGHQALNGEIPAGALISFFANGYDKEWLASEKPYRIKTSYSVHEHVRKTKDTLDMGSKSFSKFVSSEIKFKEQDEGWVKVGTCTREQVLAFARQLEQLIEKAKQ